MYAGGVIPRVAALSSLLVALPLVALPLGCGRDRQEAPIGWTTLDDGLQYALVTRLGKRSGARFKVHVLRFEPARWQQRIATPALMGSKTSDIGEFRKKVGGVAAINSGYFDPQLRPLGLMVSQGKELSRLRQVDHGIFTVAAGQPGLQHARSYKEPADLGFAVECGPRLVVDARPLTFKTGVARRTAIGHDRAGRVYWIVSTMPMSLADLADFLVCPADRGGPGLTAALNLDGGKSTVFDLKSGKTSASVRSSLQVPVGIVLVRR